MQNTLTDLNNHLFDREAVKAFIVFNYALVSRNPYKRRCIQFATYAPIRTSSLKTVACFAFLRLAVAFNSTIRLKHPARCI